MDVLAPRGASPDSAAGGAGWLHPGHHQRRTAAVGVFCRPGRGGGVSKRHGSLSDADRLVVRDLHTQPAVGTRPARLAAPQRTPQMVDRWAVWAPGPPGTFTASQAARWVTGRRPLRGADPLEQRPTRWTACRFAPAPAARPAADIRCA